MDVANNTSFAADVSCRGSKGNGLPSAIVKVTAYSLVWIVSLIGNTCVIGVVIRSPRLRKPINYFIASMAASDLAVPLFAIPIRVVEEMRGSDEWLIHGTTGTVLCKLCYFFTDLSPMVSVLTLVIISIDRFRAVARPFRASTRTISNGSCIIVIVTTWLISMAVFAPYFYTFRLMQQGGHTVCAGSWEPAFDHVITHTLYVTIICVVFLMVPYVVLIVLYSRMLYHLRVTSALGAAMKTLQVLKTDRRRNQRIVCMALAIVLTFGACWMPFMCYLLISFHRSWKPPQPCVTTPFFVVQFLSFVNAAANPCVYFVFIRSYWRELKCLLTNNQYAAESSTPRPAKANSSGDTIRHTNMRTVSADDGYDIQYITCL